MSWWLLLAAATAQVIVGGTPLRADDYLDGRAIADATGAPVVLLTLTPAAAKRINNPLPPVGKVVVTLDKVEQVARLADATIEIDGLPDFKTATALALALTGKPPLPDSLDE